jgi:hypothetical protein
MNIKLLPWTVPNFASIEMPARNRGDGFQEAPKFHVSDIDAETLSEQCDKFRAEVFRKAGKTDTKRKEM